MFSVYVGQFKFESPGNQSCHCKSHSLSLSSFL